MSGHPSCMINISWAIFDVFGSMTIGQPPISSHLLTFPFSVPVSGTRAESSTTHAIKRQPLNGEAEPPGHRPQTPPRPAAAVPAAAAPEGGGAAPGSPPPRRPPRPAATRQPRQHRRPRRRGRSPRVGQPPTHRPQHLTVVRLSSKIL